MYFHFEDDIMFSHMGQIIHHDSPGGARLLSIREWKLLPFALFVDDLMLAFLGCPWIRTVQ